MRKQSIRVFYFNVIIPISVKLLKDRIEDSEARKTDLQRQLDELTDKHVTMHARLQVMTLIILK